MITVLSGAILGEAVGVRRWIAVATGFAGVLLVVQPGSGIMGWAALLPLIAASALRCIHHDASSPAAKTPPTRCISSHW